MAIFLNCFSMNVIFRVSFQSWFSKRSKLQLCSTTWAIIRTIVMWVFRFEWVSKLWMGLWYFFQSMEFKISVPWLSFITWKLTVFLETATHPLITVRLMIPYPQESQSVCDNQPTIRNINFAQIVHCHTLHIFFHHSSCANIRRGMVQSKYITRYLTFLNKH